MNLARFTFTPVWATASWGAAVSNTSLKPLSSLNESPFFSFLNQTFGKVALQMSFYKKATRQAPVKPVARDAGPSSFLTFPFIFLGFILLTFADFFTVSPHSRLIYGSMLFSKVKRNETNNRDSRKEEGKIFMKYWECPPPPPHISLITNQIPWNPQQPGLFYLDETRNLFVKFSNGLHWKE